MIRKFTIGLLFCSVGLFLGSCKDEEASSPPKTAFAVDKTSGRANDTDFTFTVDQVSADAISLLPYGTENPSFGGILIPKSSFVNGKATVTVKYTRVGTYNAVVVANNHTGDGDAANTYSDVKAITVTSDKTEFKDFSFEKSTKTEVTGNNIVVTVPYGTDLTKLKGIYTTSPFTTVSVGGANQSSGATENNFTSPVTYTVTANEGNTTAYTVTVVTTAIESKNTIKSASGKSDAKASNKDREFPAYVDNTNRIIVIYDKQGTAADAFDSVRFKYALDGAFANLKYGGKKLVQDSMLNLTSMKELVVRGQDSVSTGAATYKLYSAAAPKLELAFNGLNPTVTGKTDNFNVTLTVLTGTVLTDLVATSTVTPDASGTVTGVKAYEDGDSTGQDFVSGVTALDFSKPVRFELTVDDARGFTYKVNYTVSVVVTP
jgi:trimeric autotransporter adhesin